MQLRLKNSSDVRRFSLVITVVALVAGTALHYVFLPRHIFDVVATESAIITIMLASPISYYVGLKLRDVHKLTVQLEHSVNHDQLTGMCTRTSFYDQLEGMEDMPLVVIVTDVDNFKRINDRHGHQAGDVALKHFASTLMRNCREDDVIARFGGEEFVILLRETTLKDGVLAAQRLRDQVRQKSFVINARQVQITASFGVSEVASVDEIDKAIHNADMATFRAKRDGRDRVCQYDADLDVFNPRRTAAE